MVSPEYIDEQKTEEKPIVSPTEKQVPIVIENSRPWLKPLRVLSGVVVPLIGGIAIMYLTIFVAGAFFFGGIVAFFVGIVGGVLLRSYWAILVVPIAVTLGEFLVVYLVKPDFMGVLDLGFGGFILVFTGPMLALFGSLICTSLVKKAQGPGLTTIPKDC